MIISKWIVLRINLGILFFILGIQIFHLCKHVEKKIGQWKKRRKEFKTKAFRNQRKIQNNLKMSMKN